MLFWLSLILVGICAFVYFSPKGGLQLIETLLSKLNAFCSRIWNSDPIAIKNYKINEKSKEIAGAVNNAETSQKEIHSLERRIEKAEAESNRLQSLAEQYVKDGNDVKAAEKLTEKEDRDLELIENKQSLAQHKKMFDDNMSQINHSAGQINKLKNQARNQGMRLHFAEADANLSKMSKLIGKSVDFTDFDEVDEAIESKIDGLKSVREVASKLTSDSDEDRKMEEKAKQEQVQGKLKALKEKMKVS